MRRLVPATIVALMLAAAAASPAAAFDTFVVNSTADTSDANAGNGDCDVDTGTIGEQCTLRAAIQEANALANVGLFADQITFAIGASGSTATISPGTVLPTITERVGIDGRTQPGYAGVPLVTVKGTGTTGADFDGFVIGAGGDGSEVSGLVLNNFHTAIRADFSVTALGNYIGLLQDGTAGAGSANGKGIQNSASSGGIGDAFGTSNDRNVISNNNIGIDVVAGGGSFQIGGNYIGTDPTGTLDRGNATFGVHTVAAVIIQGGNVISGNGTDGVRINGTFGFVSSSLIGTNAAGTAAIPNGSDGVALNNSGVVTVNDNVISGNTGAGISALNEGPDVNGNKIGVGSDGTTAIPNGAGGIDLGSNGSHIGGNGTNVIANNTGFGVRVLFGAGNVIDGTNSFFANDGLAIDLGTAGFNPNVADPQPGEPNFGQNYPSLTSAVAGGNVAGTLTSQANTVYTIDLFLSTSCDPSFYGEGETFLKTVSVNTDPSGIATFSTALPASATVGKVVTATATDTAAGNTSEFSLCRTVTAATGGGGSGGGGSTQKTNGEPDSNINRVRSQKARKLKKITGTASDPEGQLAAVEIAVVAVQGGAKATAKRVKRCLNLQRNGKLKRKKAGKRGRCAPAKFLRAKGTAKWTYKLKRRLRKGKYVVYARAVDKAGKKETKFSKADRNRVAFKLR